MEVVKQLMKSNKHIASVVCNDSLDKQRVDNSSEHTRNYHFSKANNYAFMLYKMGVSMYGPTYKDWPSDCLYNMDEIGIDITKHHNK
eukprot:7444070-Ditylum_brightwellii.AAC.1